MLRSRALTYLTYTLVALLPANALAATAEKPQPLSTFRGCEDTAKTGDGAESADSQASSDPRRTIEAARAPRERKEVISGRVFKSFSLKQVATSADTGAADCWGRLDGVWREESEIMLDRDKDPEGWDGTSSLQLSIANGNFTSPAFIVVQPSEDRNRSVRISPAFDPSSISEFVSTDGVKLSDALRIRGPVKTYLGPDQLKLRVDVTLSGYVRLRLGNRMYLRPKPGVTKAVAENQTPANDAFLVSFTLENMIASRRGYDVITQDPFFLMQNGKAEVLAQVDRRNYVIEERRIVPMGFTLHKIDAQGTVFRKDLSTSEQDTQRTNAHSFGANISGAGEILGYGVKASAGYDHAQTATRSMRKSSTVAQAVAIARVKQYALIVDHPYVTLSDGFIDAVEDARRYGDYQALIRRFGTHYPYATTFGAVGKMTQNFSQTSLGKSLTTEQKNSFNTSLSVSNPVGPSMAADAYYSNTQGRSNGNRNVSENERNEFVAAGGNGSWNEMGFSAGQTPYPILLDLRPLHELLNPINFPDQPEVYLAVRANLARAIKHHIEEKSGGLSEESLVAKFASPVSRGKRKFVKNIVTATGKIKYYRTDNVPRVGKNRMRLCLVNQSPGAKLMTWTKGQAGVNPLSALKNPSKSCAFLKLNQRIEWIFINGMLPVKSDGMNLKSFGGALVEFVW